MSFSDVYVLVNLMIKTIKKQNLLTNSFSKIFQQKSKSNKRFCWSSDQSNCFSPITVIDYQSQNKSYKLFFSFFNYHWCLSCLISGPVSICVPAAGWHFYTTRRYDVTHSYCCHPRQRVHTLTTTHTQMNVDSMDACVTKNTQKNKIDKNIQSTKFNHEVLEEVQGILEEASLVWNSFLWCFKSILKSLWCFKDHRSVHKFHEGLRLSSL